MRIGTSIKHRKNLDTNWDAIVIGSGIGGLAAAAMLARAAGKRVLVLERHYTAGGFTHTFRRPGYEWDVGVHYIGDVTRQSMLRRVFDYVTAGELQWADMGDVYDRIVLGDDVYDLVKGKEAFRAQMHAYFPNERDAIDEYIARVLDTAKKGALFFAEKAVPRPISKLLGGFMRRPILKEARLTTREVLESITQNQELIGVLTGQWGDYGLPPNQSSFFIHAMVASHYFRGGAYPIGGSSRIAETILPVIESAGGEVITCAEVQEIVIEKGRAVGVRLENGAEYRAPCVVSDAGVVNTLAKLLPHETHGMHGLLDKAEAVGPSAAHISLYIGLNASTEALELKRPNLWVYKDHRHEENLARYLADQSAPFPVVYLSFPSAKDPDFEHRFPGHAAIEAITIVKYEQFESWADTAWKKRGAEYDALKANLTERLLETLYKYCPKTRQHIDIAELSTPLTTRNFANHPHGEIYGLSHTPARFEQRWLQPRTPIPGLYFTGADICSAGVAGALMGGALCTSAVLGTNMLGVIKKAPSTQISTQPRDFATT